MKKILFVCKHNLFRSRTAEIFFKKMNKNKKYSSDSAGLIKWDKSLLKGDSAFNAEKKTCKKFGIGLKFKSKGLSSSILKKTDLVVIVADDVPKEIFNKEKSFNGKVLVWKTKDVKSEYRNKEKVAEDTIKFIEKKVKNLASKLK